MLNFADAENNSRIFGLNQLNFLLNIINIQRNNKIAKFNLLKFSLLHQKWFLSENLRRRLTYF